MTPSFHLRYIFVTHSLHLVTPQDVPRVPPNPSQHRRHGRSPPNAPQVFGPLITVIRFESDDELVRLCNDCPFALGSSAFGDDAHITRVGKRIQAGMLACNDFATCYMCQSLPMGGLKDSGFGKFAGIEGLRGCCLTKAVVEDRFSFMRTQVTPRDPA